MSNKIIMHNSDEAAREITPEEAVDILTGRGTKLWLGGNGKIYSIENLARFESSTHSPCADCGAPSPKPYILCDECRERKRTESYRALPLVKLADCAMPIYSGAMDRYFFDEAELVDALIECDLDSDAARLVECEPVKIPYIDIDSDFFSDALPEDSSVSEVASPRLLKAIDALNEVIRAEPPWSYVPGKRRVNADDLLAEAKEES